MKKFGIMLAAALTAASLFCISCQKNDPENKGQQTTLEAVSGGWYDRSTLETQTTHDAILIREDILQTGTVSSVSLLFTADSPDYQYVAQDKRGLDFMRYKQESTVSTSKAPAKIEEHVLVKLDGELLKIAFYTIPDNGMYRNTTMFRGEFEL